MVERIPKMGEFYRDMENKLYQIAAVAENTETGETLVVYQALYGTYRFLASPLAVFNRKTDKHQYPQVQQEYAFEPVKFLAQKREMVSEEDFLDSGSEFEELSFDDPFDEMFVMDFHDDGMDDEMDDEADDETDEDLDGETGEDRDDETNEEIDKETDEGMKNEATKWLEYFLDAEGYEKQLEVLAQMRGKVGQRELSSICLVLGIPVLSGDEDMQIANIIKHLETRMRYDTRRLR